MLPKHCLISLRNAKKKQNIFEQLIYNVPNYIIFQEVFHDFDISINNFSGRYMIPKVLY